MTASFLKYSFTDDLPNLDELQVPLSHAIPTTPPWSFSEQRKTYALALEVAGFAIPEDTDLQIMIMNSMMNIKN